MNNESEYEIQQFFYPKQTIMKIIPIVGIMLGILIVLIYCFKKENLKTKKINKIMVSISIFIDFWLYLVSKVSWGRGNNLEWIDPPLSEQIIECIIPGILPLIIQIIAFITLIINIIKNKKKEESPKCQE